MQSFSLLLQVLSLFTEGVAFNLRCLPDLGLGYRGCGGCYQRFPSIDTDPIIIAATS